MSHRLVVARDYLSPQAPLEIENDGRLQIDG
jgi:hypothetical protein